MQNSRIVSFVVHVKQYTYYSNKSAKRQSRTPIIIIPAATSSSLITMFNVKDILQVTFHFQLIFFSISKKEIKVMFCRICVS